MTKISRKAVKKMRFCILRLYDQLRFGGYGVVIDFPESLPLVTKFLSVIYCHNGTVEGTEQTGGKEIKHWLQ